MKEQTRAALALSLIKGLGIHTFRYLLEKYGTPQAVFASSTAQLKKLRPEIAQSISTRATFPAADQILSTCTKLNIQVLFIEDEAYPPLLKQIQLPPILLYVKGQLNVLKEEPSVAIVGTRQITQYGKEAIDQISAALSAHKVSVISGLGQGVEAYVTESTIRHKIGRVIVYPAGLQHPYPHNVPLRLIEEAQSEGCLLSEHPPYAKLQKHAFLARHRITVGLSQHVVLIESKIPGGSMQIARIAQSENREVHAIPGDINKQRSQGANQLIRGNVAQLLTSADDLMRSLNLPTQTAAEKPAAQPQPQLNPDEEKIIDILKKAPEGVHIDQISQETALSIDQISFLLFNMECQNIIERLPGSSYRISRSPF